MFNLFKKNKRYLEKKGYLLVTVYDHKEHVTVNYIFDRSTNSFEKKKLFAINTIPSNSYFEHVNEAIDEVSGRKEFKRFLANSNVTGIYYSEIEVVEKIKNKFTVDGDLIRLYYVPSKMKMRICEEDLINNLG